MKKHITLSLMFSVFFASSVTAITTTTETTATPTATATPAAPSTTTSSTPAAPAATTTGAATSEGSAAHTATETPASTANETSTKHKHHTKAHHAKIHHVPHPIIRIDEKILEENSQNTQVQQLIKNAFELSKQKLKYIFGSEDPRNGGLDCSGAIRYLLKASKLQTPRQADQIYQWAWLQGKFHGVNANSFKSFEFSKLSPGNLLFWTDTYKVDRDPPITHVMLYLGKNKDHQPMMFGAASARNGVGVFNFKIRNSPGKSRFIGYSCIPGLNCA